MRWFIIFTLLIAGTLGAQEPFSPAHREAAKRLIALEGGKTAYEDGLRRALDEQSAVNPQFARVRDVVDTWQQKYVGWKKIEPAYVETICRAYTEEDIAALIAFYETEAGGKLLEKSGELGFEIMMASQRIGQAHQLELQMMIQERFKQMKVEAQALVPGWIEPEPAEALEDRYFKVHTSSNLMDGDFKELVYMVKGRDLLVEPEANPFDDQIPLAMGEALKIAYEGFYKQMNIPWQKYIKEADLQLSRYTFKPNEDGSKNRDVWYYVVSVGFMPGAALSQPPEAVVLTSGKLVTGQSKN